MLVMWRYLRYRELSASAGSSHHKAAWLRVLPDPSTWKVDQSFESCALKLGPLFFVCLGFFCITAEAASIHLGSEHSMFPKRTFQEYSAICWFAEGIAVIQIKMERFLGTSMTAISHNIIRLASLQGKGENYICNGRNTQVSCSFIA